MSYAYGCILLKFRNGCSTLNPCLVNCQVMCLSVLALVYYALSLIPCVTFVQFCGINRV